MAWRVSTWWRHTKGKCFGLIRPEGILKLLWLSTRIMRLAQEESDACKLVFNCMTSLNAMCYWNSTTAYTEKYLYNGPQKRPTFVTSVVTPTAMCDNNNHLLRGRKLYQRWSWIFLQVCPTRWTILLKYIYFSSLHVSGIHVLHHQEKNYCIYVTLVFVTLYGWRLICWLEFNPNQKTRRHPYRETSATVP